MSTYTLSAADRAGASPFRTAEAPVRPEWEDPPPPPPPKAFTGGTPPVLIPDPARNAVLATALDAMAPAGTPARVRLDRVALTVVKVEPGRAPLAYAGVHEHDPHFAASLLKLALLPASFDLVAAVNRLASTLPAGADVLAAAKARFAADIGAAVPGLPYGPWRSVTYGETLAVAAPGTGPRVSLSTRHSQELVSIVANQGQNVGAQRCVRRLGFSYVNGSAAAGGFLDVATRRGIWMASDFIVDGSGSGWPSFYAPVLPAGKSSLVMTTNAMAGLLVAMVRGHLVDGASSTAMRKILGQGGAWLSMTGAEGDMGFTVEGAKVGHASSGTARVGLVKSEAAVVRRKDGAEFVAVWQNLTDGAPGTDTLPVYRVIDALVRTWP